MTTERGFRLALLGLVLLGLMVRSLQYASCPPFRATNDELAYPWAGLSLLQSRVPISWSPFKSYPTQVQKNFWGEDYTLVKPYLEKPLLYPILTAVACLAHGERTFPQVRYSTFRLVPLFLSAPSIWFLGLAARRVGGRRVGLLTAAIYATLPTIVLGNRMSLTENLLIPLSLISWWLLERGGRIAPQALTCALAVMTKQPGIYIPGAVILALYARKERKALLAIGGVSCLALLVHPLVAWHYDWAAYVGASQELRAVHAKGLPEMLQTIVRFPIVTHKDVLFLDGSMLLGWLLLLTSPFWWQGTRQVLLYPILYLVLIALGEGGTTFYGWHVFPLFPYVALALARALVQALDSGNSGQLALLGLGLGSATLRFWFTLYPVEHWQPWLTFVMMLVFLVISLAHHGRPTGARRLGWLLIITWLLMTVQMDTRLPELYMTAEQPP